jgi:hypothetical protein
MSDTLYLTSRQAMKRLGYSNTKTFLQMVRQESVPHLIINSRRIVFPIRGLEQWEAKRMIGSADSSGY